MVLKRATKKEPKKTNPTQNPTVKKTPKITPKIKEKISQENAKKETKKTKKASKILAAILAGSIVSHGLAKENLPSPKEIQQHIKPTTSKEITLKKIKIKGKRELITKISKDLYTTGKQLKKWMTLIEGVLPKIPKGELAAKIFLKNEDEMRTKIITEEIQKYIQKIAQQIEKGINKKNLEDLLKEGATFLAKHEVLKRLGEGEIHQEEYEKELKEATKKYSSFFHESAKNTWKISQILENLLATSMEFRRYFFMKIIEKEALIKDRDYFKLLFGTTINPGKIVFEKYDSIANKLLKLKPKSQKGIVSFEGITYAKEETNWELYFKALRKEFGFKIVEEKLPNILKDLRFVRFTKDTTFEEDIIYTANDYLLYGDLLLMRKGKNQN